MATTINTITAMTIIMTTITLMITIMGTIMNMGTIITTAITATCIMAKDRRELLSPA